MLLYVADRKMLTLSYREIFFISFKSTDMLTMVFVIPLFVHLILPKMYSSEKLFNYVHILVKEMWKSICISSSSIIFN